MNVYYLLLYISVAMTAFSQVLLKLSSVEKKKRGTELLRNPKIYLAYSMLLTSLSLNTYSLRTVPLSHMAFILPLSFVFVPLLSKSFLNEKLSRSYWRGTCLIIIGSLVYNSDFII